ncbi:unnamed protein product [Ranitomeya imitator]|uniref:Reverse transcriptase domain-containing protein n=1 Tax=Ranitomeya imitator TaxID=111125 RepID=A0ABN9L970_9NEOB|nr:unnamed protein product [Ranitomeya imitator]
MRLTSVISGLVHSDQSGFMPDRSTAINLRRLYMNLQLRSNNCGQRVIASLDAHKAFDSVEWGYLWQVLRSMGFGPQFISWIRLMYSMPMARVRFGSKYGPVSMAYLGPKKVLILNGYDVVREAFLDNAEVFSDRPRLAIPEMVFKGHGLIFTNGERWRQMRRFTLSTLRNFGMGKRSLEARVQEEARCLGEEFEKRSGTFFDPTFLITLGVSNVVCAIVFEDRYDYEDKDFLDMLALMKETFQSVTSSWAQVSNVYI